ncbi:hypothetical protein [Rhizobium laguerreae]|uniref:hypothetical protein n=1 Tax=Rhizobium laguerreae TaxID=1076926 RepID=UPI001C9004E7|nr:hypothetical protein [Rhizobium laguerreae]MBY3188797.1 hypothetical protein [Rhizobium laguerreae]
MFQIAVHYLNPPQTRANTLHKAAKKGEEISEAVNDITLEPGERLLDFMCLKKREVISHICWSRRGQRAATQLRRLNLDAPEEISPIDVVDLLQKRGWAKFRPFFEGRDVFHSSEDSADFVAKMRATFPDVERFIKEAETDYGLIDELDQHSVEVVRQEHDAVEMALRIANIIPRNAYQWSPSKRGVSKINSFFTGLKPASLLEDDVVRWDLNKIPGFNTIDDAVFGHYVLGNGSNILHTFHANKNALEKTLGVDLIYFNEQHENFALVQYKMAEQQGDTHVFRFPNQQLTLEIQRMDQVMAVLQGSGVANAGTPAHDFRLADSPFFLKFCPRDGFEPDENEQIRGMIIPLSMWKLIEDDKSNMFLGPAGGSILSFDNCPRYLDNTQFISMFQDGWLGTISNHRGFLEKVITEIINSGRSLILAAKLRPEKVEQVVTANVSAKKRRGSRRKKK